MSSPVPSPNSEPWARAVPPGTEQLLLVVTPSLCCGLPGSSLPRTQLCPQCPGAGCRGVSGSAPHPRLPLAFLGLVGKTCLAQDCSGPGPSSTLDWLYGLKQVLPTRPSLRCLWLFLKGAVWTEDFWVFFPPLQWVLLFGMWRSPALTGLHLTGWTIKNYAY